MGKSSRLGIQEMANQLELRKNINHHTVLLLGARAGQLFRSAHFYDKLQFVSKRNFHQLSLIKQFRECYTILTEGKFSEMDLHSILQTALQAIDPTNVDVSLAALIRNQYFDEIISTNIDDVLEDALLQVEMKEGRDYEVIRIGHNLGHNALRHEKKHPFRITKPFGDFASQDYIIRGRPSHLEKPGLKSFLQNLLGKDLLIVGLDPTWDQDILRVIPVNTKATIWFVSEDNDIVGKSSFLSDVLRALHATYILGPKCSYDFFVRELHKCLYGNVSPTYLSTHSQTIQQEVARMIEILEQYANNMALLPGINDRLQSLQNATNAFFGEIQAIQKKLEEIEKHQHDS